MKEVVIILILFSLIPVAFAEQYPELGVKIEIVADNLTIPWSIDWLPDGTALFTERNGNLRIIQGGELLEEPLLSLEVGGAEGGMLGVAVDPDYSENGFIYLYYTYNEFVSTSNKIVRYHLDGTELIENRILMEGIPGGPFHDGGRIQFGPDEKLYITTGDAGNPDLAQDLDSAAGKILRINSDGTIPDDNPFQNSPIYSFGHRNPQGIDWDEFGNLVATEHGPSGWRGNAHDEINVISPGKNYGWPHVIGNETSKGMQNSILHTGDDTWAPSGAEFYDGDKIPQWNGKYFVATLRGSHLHMIDFDLQNNKVRSHEKLFQDDYGRLRDVQTGPDGYLYVLTSNQDGRGKPQINDDKILQVSPMSVVVDSFEYHEGKFHVVQEQHFTYSGEGGPLDVKLQYNEYDISPIRFDIDKKSISFDFERLDGKFASNRLQFESGIGLQIDRPLISPPYTVTIETGDDMLEYQPRGHEIDIIEDDRYEYRLSLDKEWKKGTVTITGTYVIPEFGSLTLIILTVGIISMFVWIKSLPKMQI